jgi:S-adenosylmethionine hydrolase
VHIAVVDPGVGTKRHPIVARLGGHTFVGPDNGIFTPMYEDAEQYGLTMDVVYLVNEKYWLPNVSHTFHGRDIFAPVAAHLANGVPLSDLGPALRDPVRIPLPKPERTAKGWRAHITMIDVFGNCTTDLPASEIVEKKNPVFRICGHEVRGLAQSYGHKQPGELIALVDSENFVEIAVVNGSAAHAIGAQVGDVVEVLFKTR